MIYLSYKIVRRIFMYDYSYYSYDYPSYSGSSGGILAALAGVGLAVWIVGMAISVLMIISMWMIFKKNGKAGWIAIIPFYNMWTFFEICDILVCNVRSNFQVVAATAFKILVTSAINSLKKNCRSKTCFVTCDSKRAQIFLAHINNHRACIKISIEFCGNNFWIVFQVSFDF